MVNERSEFQKIRDGMARTDEELYAHYKEDIRLNPDKYDYYDGPYPKLNPEQQAAKDADTPRWFIEMNEEIGAICRANKAYAPIERWEAELRQSAQKRKI